MRKIFVLAAIGLTSCGGTSADQEGLAADSENVTNEVGGAATSAKQIAWNEKGMDAIKTKLKDPDSAQFRDVEFYDGVAPVTCGLVNAKNSFGGYSGFERFIAGGDIITVLESEMAAGEMDKLWPQVCK